MRLRAFEDDDGGGGADTPDPKGGSQSGGDDSAGGRDNGAGLADRPGSDRSSELSSSRMSFSEARSRSSSNGDDNGDPQKGSPFDSPGDAEHGPSRSIPSVSTKAANPDRPLAPQGNQSHQRFSGFAGASVGAMGGFAVGPGLFFMGQTGFNAGPKGADVYAGVFIGFAGLGGGIGPRSPSLNLGGERTTDSNGISPVDCIPAGALVTPLGYVMYGVSKDTSGQSEISFAEVSFGLSVSLGVFSGVYCGFDVRR